MPSYSSNIRPCKALTLKGKILLWLTRIVVRIASLFITISKEHPLVFEEDPLTMSRSELLYFAYKYYIKNISFPSKANYLKLPNGGKTYHPDNTDMIKVNLGGDLMPYKIIQPRYCANLWTERLAFFDADIVAANLETPIDIQKKHQYVPEMMLGNMHFNGSKAQFDIFNGNNQTKGFDVLSLANNHTLDMGYEGMKRTAEFLKRQGIQTCGTGLRGLRYSIIERKGLKIGFVSWTYSLNHLKPNLDSSFNVNHLPMNRVDGCDITPITQEIRDIKEEGADFVIAMLHCGNAYQPFPGRQTQALFERIAHETEVNFIVGGHPHNIQPIQEFDTVRGPIVAAYSLGDFIAYDIYQRCHLSLYLELNLRRVRGQVELINFKVHTNFMQFKGQELRLRNFEEVLDENRIDKKIADLQMLYQQTISGCPN